ncbi:hypothetical protein LCGC14_1796040 [marine sediment metagenome]|uniref:HTH lysR-type domain-containing protein n=1 Tax=marine sediment metagenome TaxID=412755 RepID=A0A0F9J5Y0_9ZZZZ
MEKVELKDISAFVQITRSGSLTRAAKETGTPKATLSHGIRRLEDALGVELLVRSARGVTLTEAGRAYLENTNRIFDSCEVAASAAKRAHSSIDGKVRIAASAEFGTSILGAATLYLAREHEGLEFEIRMYSSEALVSGQLEFDCMIYIGSAPDSDHMCRKMGTVSYGLYASPQFIQTYGEPKTLADTAKLPGVEYRKHGVLENWSLRADKQEVQANYMTRFSVHDYWMAKFFCVSGVALAYLPDFFIHYEVDLGALVPVLPEMRSEEIAAWIVYPKSRNKNPRVTLVVDTLCEKFDEFVLHPGYSLIPK